METKRLIGTSTLMALALGGCGAQAMHAEAPHAAAEPGSLALVVQYTTLCSSSINNNAECAQVSWPEVCWTGTCVENCGAQGAKAFNVCAPGGSKTEIPFEIDQTATSNGLASGKWQLHATSPKWKLDCAAEVGGDKPARAVIDSAREKCI